MGIENALPAAQRFEASLGDPECFEIVSGTIYDKLLEEDDIINSSQELDRPIGLYWELSGWVSTLTNLSPADKEAAHRASYRGLQFGLDVAEEIAPMSVDSLDLRQFQYQIEAAGSEDSLGNYITQQVGEYLQRSPGIKRLLTSCLSEIVADDDLYTDDAELAAGFALLLCEQRIALQYAHEEANRLTPEQFLQASQ